MCERDRRCLEERLESLELVSVLLSTRMQHASSVHYECRQVSGQESLSFAQDAVFGLSAESAPASRALVIMLGSCFSWVHSDTRLLASQYVHCKYTIHTWSSALPTEMIWIARGRRSEERIAATDRPADGEAEQ